MTTITVSSDAASPRGTDGGKMTSSVYAGTSKLQSIAAGRISFMQALIGPCLALDTACSSTLVTTHLARTAVSQLECRQGLSVGVGYLEAMGFAAFAAAGMLSSLGRCHTFDL